MKSKISILLLTLIAFSLRVYGLNIQPLWGDEGWSIYFASMSLPDMLALTAVDIHPPLYYALLQAWFFITQPSPELARFLSVIFGTLLIPLTYKVGNQVIPAPTSNHLGGIAPAAVVTLAPMSVYYSQEVRMYGLVTLLGLLSTYFFIQALTQDKKAHIPYIISTSLALYTMYYAVFIVAFQGLYLLIKYRLRHPLFKSLIVVGCLYLPWILYAGNKLISYVAQKVNVEEYTPLNIFQFFSSYLIAFSQGHPSQALQPYTFATLIFIILALIGFLHLFSDSHHSVLLSPLPPCSPPALLLTLYLLTPLILAWLVNLLNPFTPRHFERTVLIAAPAWYLFVGAGLASLWHKRIIFFRFMALLIAIISLVGLVDFYITPRYPDEDYRPLLAKIAAQATVDDVVLASYQWQLGYYYAYLPAPRPQLYAVPKWGVTWGTDINIMRRDLTELLQTHRIWFPAHQSTGHLWEDQAEKIMAEIGYPAYLHWYNPTTKLSLVASKTQTEPGPIINFGHKLQAEIKRPINTHFASGHGIIPLEIIWTGLAPLDQDYLITIKLVDDTGEIWAKRDTFPQANQATFSQLRPNQSLGDRHGLLITAGTPPGAYSLRLVLTGQSDETPLNIINETGQVVGVEAPLMTITVEPARMSVGAAALAIQSATDINFDNTLNLLGYSLAEQAIKTGETLPINLFWQSLDSNLPPLTMFVQLQDEQGQAVALTERPPAYSSDKWQTGTLLRDLHILKIPASLAPGVYKLAAGVLLPDKTRLQTQFDNQVILGSITVVGRPHHFDPPSPDYPLIANFNDQATLLGYNMKLSNSSANNTITLTLYWRGEAGFERKWAIFAHLVDDKGQIWGQRDQFPADGALPTSSWIKGEIISDTRQIPLPSEMPPGPYFIEVGLYDPHTFERVPIQGRGDAITFEKPIFFNEE